MIVCGVWMREFLKICECVGVGDWGVRFRV